MSLSSMTRGGVPKSFQSSAALHDNNSHSNNSATRSASRKSSLSKLPSISSGSRLPKIGGSSSSLLPSIHGKEEKGNTSNHDRRKLSQQESVSVIEKKSVKRRNRLAPLDGSESLDQHPHKSKQKRKKDRKSEERHMIKEQVNMALKAVREVFDTDKGKDILALETKVERSRVNDTYINCKLKRKDENSSLGISFTIPARVMALGWESGQHLVVTDVTEKPGVKANLQKGDIVVAVDDVEVHTIQDLKNCVQGKKKMHVKCVRDLSTISPEELQSSQQRIERSLKTAVKAKVREQLRARR